MTTLTTVSLTKVYIICHTGTYPAIECMQHRVSSAVSDAARSVCLSTFTKVQTLTTERTLVDLTIIHTTEWHSNVLQLTDTQQQKLTIYRYKARQKKSTDRTLVHLFQQRLCSFAYGALQI